MTSIHSAGEVRAYRRELPGGGFVAIDVRATRGAIWRPRRYIGEVVVERRSTAREGQVSPVIAHATASTVEAVVRALLPVARCNGTIGAALLHLNPVVRGARPPAAEPARLGPYMNKNIRVLIMAAAATITACGHAPVRTMAAPGTRMSGLATYRILKAPTVRYGLPSADPTDPMVEGSAANRLLRDRVAATLATRGYVPDERAPDIDVAVYASVRPDVDVTRWSYGYAFIPDWPRWPPPPLPSATEGRIIVDVLEGSTKTLLWRGEATTKLGSDIDGNLRQIVDLAALVVERIPIAATRRVLASGR